MELDKVAILIKKASLEFDKVSNPYFIKYELTSSQYKILKYLYSINNHQARLVDLEKIYSMTHPTALGLVSQLENKGFITKLNNPKDKRGKFIVLTEKALLMQNELENVGEEIENNLTKNLTIKEKNELIFLLKKIIKVEN